MSKYRKLPVVIEAFKYLFEEMPDWATKANGFINPNNEDEVLVRTLEGDMKAKRGDYIIKGINGELYPCRADIFHKTYEKVE